MADDKVTSAIARVVSLVVVLALGAFYVLVAHEWYFKGKMLLCTYNETMTMDSWCYRSYPNVGQGCSVLNGHLGC